MLSKVIELIDAQNPQEGSLEHGVGEMLKSIAAANPAHAEIIAQDLRINEMSLKACGQKLYEYASKNRKGNSYCMTPVVAEKLIREFYGLAGKTTVTSAPLEAPTSAAAPVIDLTDLL